MNIEFYNVGDRCKKCSFDLHMHDYIGVFCPLCSYRSIEISFAANTNPLNQELPIIPPDQMARGGLTT